MPVNGLSLGAVAAGSILVYSGVTGKSILSVIAGVVQGNSPGTIASTLGIHGTPATDAGSLVSSGVDTIVGSNGGGNVTSSDAKTALKQAAAAYGWDTGPEWAALNAIEMQEAGYDPKSTNPSSRAYGLAQSLGHGFTGGPASNGINEYGGEGLTPEQSRAASLGDPRPQAIWMCHYIKGRYGDPIKAEQFHLANNWY